MPPKQTRQLRPALVTQLTTEQETELSLIKAAQEGNIHAQNKLILQWLPWVKRISKQYAIRAGRLDLISDLVNTALCGTDSYPSGLCQAIKKFDHSAKARFSTYASYWINEALTKYIMKETVAVKSPRIAKTDYRIRKIYQEVEEFLGRPPNLDEVQRAMASTEGNQLTEKRLQKAFEDTSLEDLNEEHGASEVDIESHLEKRELADAIKALPERQSEVIIRRFIYGETLREIAAALGMTFQNVSLIEQAALETLKEKLSND